MQSFILVFPKQGKWIHLVVNDFLQDKPSNESRVSLDSLKLSPAESLVSKHEKFKLDYMSDTLSPDSSMNSTLQEVEKNRLLHLEQQGKFNILYIIWMYWSSIFQFNAIRVFQQRADGQCFPGGRHGFLLTLRRLLSHEWNTLQKHQSNK